jgi:two-component system chemotaxis response regulator CheY
MKILVLNNDLKERTIIQQVLLHNGHELMTADSSDSAMQLLQEGEIRFVIADRATTDMDAKQFVQRVRDAQPPHYIYILLLTPNVQDTDITIPRAGADDYLHKPIVPPELKSRVHIGERILALGDNLAVARDTMERIAMYDPLTGVFNQKAFVTFSYGELERSRRGQSPLSLIALEIDNFSAINQEFGEEIGNDVLTVVAQGIREKSRPYDGVGRYGADTFLIILPGVIGQDAEKVADRIMKGILNTEISLMDGRNLTVQLSAGVVSSVHITAATEVEFLINRAIETMKQAQHDGGSQISTVFV